MNILGYIPFLHILPNEVIIEFVYNLNAQLHLSLTTFHDRPNIRRYTYMRDNQTFLDGLEEEGKEYLKKLISKEKLDETRFLERIQNEFNKVDKVKSPTGFLKFIIRKINLTEYKLSPTSINRIEFRWWKWSKRWIDKGFKGSQIDAITVIFIYEHCVNEFPVTVDEIEDVDQKIIDYCLQKGLTRITDIKDYFLKSRIAKRCNIPVEQLRHQAEEAILLWEKFAKTYVVIREDGAITLHDMDNEENIYERDKGIPFEISDIERNKMKIITVNYCEKILIPEDENGPALLESDLPFAITAEDIKMRANNEKPKQGKAVQE